MPVVLTNVATVYPDVQCLDTDDATLKPLFFTIKFSGTLPRHLIEQNIPIEISVSIAEEYGCFTMPFLNTMPVDLWQFNAGSSLHSGDSDADICQEYTPPPDDIPIPFLPLPPAFNYTIRADWVALSKHIEEWLVELNTELPQWTWGRDAFWLAFVAGYPFFPRGNWRMWDPRVPLEGVFIERWLEASGGSVTADQDSLAIDQGDVEDLEEIWDAFSRDAALFYPYPLISTD